MRVASMILALSGALLTLSVVDARRNDCKSSERLIQTAADIVVPDSCGAAMKGIDMGDDDPSACCRFYDVCYSTCHAPKATCDKELKKCLKNICKMSIDQQNRGKYCKQNIETLLGRLGEVSEKRYAEVQDERCECVSATAVSNRYFELGKAVVQRAYANKGKKFEKIVSKKILKFQNELMNLDNEGKEWSSFLEVMRSTPHGIIKEKAQKEDDDDL